jgi:nucleotide-binding universal stress UspA family protein
VVGVDGSANSWAAAEFAAAEALARKVALHVVCVYAESVVLPPVVGVPHPVLPSAWHVAESQPPEVLTRAVADLRRSYPGLSVVEHAIPGRPAAVLIAESTHADLLVVGARGHGGFVELLAGSVATQVASHAHCPVVVVRGASVSTGPVVMGVDASGQAEAVCVFAFTEASQRGVGLRAVRVWTPPLFEVEKIPAVRQAAQQSLAETLRSWREKYPHVAVEEFVTADGDVADVLVAASEVASLLVVGSRGRGTVKSLMLGSTGHALVHSATCPVAIVHTHAV